MAAGICLHGNDVSHATLACIYIAKIVIMKKNLPGDLQQS